MTLRFFIFATAALLLVACQPAPEERLVRAQSYFDQSDYRSAVLELKNALQKRPDFPEARVLLGKASYQLADFATAQAEFERALSLGLISAEIWTDLGRTLLAQGDADGVLERVVPNLTSETANVEQLELLGDTFMALGNRGEANENYLRALNLDPATPGALVGQAAIALSNDDSATAEEKLQQALDMNPQSDFVWRAKGNFLRAARQYSAAAEAYGEAIRLESGATALADRLMVRVNRVSALLDARQLNKAQEHFDTLSGEFPKHPVTLFLSGQLAYAKGDYSQAQDQLRQYVADYPDDLRGFALLGAVNFSQSHLSQAETYLSRAVRNNVGGMAAARLLAETQLRLDKPGEALDALGTLGSSGSDDPVTLVMYGRAQLGLGNTAAALDYFEQGAAIDERGPAVSLSLAAGFFASGDNDRAIEVLESIPDHEDTAFRREALLMAAHIGAGERDAALQVGETLLDEHANDAGAFAVVGVLRQTLGDFVEARQALERAIEIDPANRSAGYALSRLEISEGKFDDAERLLNSLLDSSPAFMPVLVTLAGVMARDGRLQDIGQRLEAAITADSDALAPRLMMIRVALLQSESAKAVRAIGEARAIFPDELRLVHAEGLAQLQQGQNEAALLNLRRAANSDRDNPTFQIDLASLGLSSGDYPLAAEAIEAYRALRPDDYRGLAIQAAIQSKQGDIEAARESVRDYARSKPEDQRADILAGDIEMAAGNAAVAAALYERASDKVWSRDLAVRQSRAYQQAHPDKAVQPLRRWLNENPDDTEMRRIYGQQLEAQGDTQRAVEQYEQLLAANSEDPIALNNLAWQYAMAGKNGAVELAERAHELAPENGSITDTLGWILFERGETVRALPLLELAAEQLPENLEIMFHLAAAYAKTGNPEQARAIIADLLEQEQAFPSRADAEELAKTL